MCLGFLGAGLLIGKSYFEWQKSPVSTSISTLSIEDLEFPNVTICPLKGSNTALNYDLMKADNHLATEQQKEKLSLDAYSVFVEAPFQEHFDKLLSQINPENVENLFRGSQSIPKVTDDNVTETRFCSLNGTFHTPWFGGDFEESFFNSDQQHRVRLEFPENLKEHIGSGSLVIDLEVNTREEWNETVWIRNDTAQSLAYKFHPEEESWEDAERICDAEGGHLASFESSNPEGAFWNVTPTNQLFWVGAMDNKTAGVWELPTDHKCTAIQISREGNQGYQGYQGYETYDHDCSTKEHAFICQAGYTNIPGKTSLRLTYTKDEVSFSTFLVQYSYFSTYSKLQPSWNERQMTGFKLSWKIENKNSPLCYETEEVGYITETPNFGTPYQPGFYKNDHTYEATLKVPENLSDLIGNGSLVIEVEVDLREGWTEEVHISRGGPKVYTFHTAKKSWHEAEAYCQSMGGSMASIQSDAELQNIDIGSHTSAWIGGIYEEAKGTWIWSDGSPWLYSLWASGYGTQHGGRHCVYLWYDYKFYDDVHCSNPKVFICQTTWHTFKERTNLTFNFTREQITFTVFKVRYNYAVSKQQLSNLGKGSQMTGFKLDWYIRDQNGSRVTNKKEANKQDWKPLDPAPKYKNSWLVRMVQLARQARFQNISIKVLIEKALNNKKLSGDTYCNTDGQLWEEEKEQFFASLERGIIPISNLTSFQNSDFHSGAKIFFAVTFCPHRMSLKLLVFFKQVFSSQSPRALIRTVVDTIQSGIIENRESQKSLNELYLALERKYDLQYGKFLLALSSKVELEEMANKGWPFFANYSQELEVCLNGTTCRDLNDIIARLGELIGVDHAHCHNVLSSDSGEVVRKAVIHPPHLLGPNNEPMPSALIPFCQYQYESLDKSISNYKSLACDRFEQSVINGRLCYSLKAQLKGRTKQGKNNGLMLMIDPGKSMDNQNYDEESSFFELYIHTLSGFSGFSAGSYAMDSLKHMTGTPGFMNLPDDQKRCQIELYEDCQESKFFGQLQEMCGCIPWAIASSRPSEKVILKF